MATFFVVTCPANKPPIISLINPCDHETCPQYPEVQCIVDRCGQCKAKFTVNQEDVTDQCSKLNHDIIKINAQIVSGMCPFEGEILKPYGTLCHQNCTSIDRSNSFVYLFAFQDVIVQLVN